MNFQYVIVEPCLGKPRGTVLQQHEVVGFEHLVGKNLARVPAVPAPVVPDPVFQSYESFTANDEE